MYDLKQFRPALYTLLLLGMSGFALAAEWVGVWVLSVAGILLNAWLIKTNRFRPLPRIIASIITIAAFLYTADQLLHTSNTAILVIGQFLVLLQLVKLYEQRANRDYAQLIILSLLLMVAAAINTASLVFGVMFIAYLFLSLYCCLLFHLKVESEQARKAIMVTEHEPNPATLRQDQRYLASSMRRLTLFISIVAVATAVNVFLFFPRGTGANLLTPLQFHQSRAMTGFSEQVTFQQVAKITQNTAPVADVKVWHNGKLLEGTEPLVLRGLTLEVYTGAGSTREGRLSRAPWQWIRLIGPGEERVVNDEDAIDLDGDQVAPDKDKQGVWRQEVTLQPLGSSVLFAMPGPSIFRPARRANIFYCKPDESLRIGEQIQTPIKYEVISRNNLIYTPAPLYSRRRERLGFGFGEIPHSEIDPKIQQYAQRPDVSGTNANGPLFQQRPTSQPVTELDDLIATNIERHLRRTFTYTLDLSDAGRILADEDPMVAFLYKLKRGHCEYFAGAMTLMCQSLGLTARMVIGFRCDEYNDVGGYYTVKQSHAHAWVEVRMADGTWKSYDPTSGNEASAMRRAGLMTRLRHVFDYLEHTWANNVIAYDRSSRDNLVQNVETQLTRTAIDSSQRLQNLPGWLRTENWEVSKRLLAGLVVLSVLALIVSIAWFLWERWRLRRRAARIGLGTLPPSDQLRLVRQLGFYDDLLQLLERRGVYRPLHLTPMEFSDSLSFLPYEVFHSVRRLTQIFYRIRYGRTEITPGQRQRLTGVIQKLEHVLGPSA